jgi:bisphosphoglycerate-independent phosphoglycerate mutase (AlkP superfamily)
LLEHLSVDDEDNHIAYNFLFMFRIDVENQIQHIMSRSSQRDNVQRDGQVVEAQLCTMMRYSIVIIK